VSAPASRAACALLLALTAAGAAGCPGRSASEASGGPRAELRIEGARVVLADGAIARLGLEVALVAPAQASVERPAFGRVLDPLPLVEPVLARSAAQRTFEQARSEYARARGLHEHDRNASTRDVELARLAEERAAFDARLAQARVAAAWGPVAAERTDLQSLATRLAAGALAVGRLDLPAGDAPAPPPETIALSLPGRAGASVAARVLGPAPTADPALQTRGVLVLFEADPPAPGTSLAARVALAQAPVAGAWLPASAVLWHDGTAVAFVETDPGAFERRPIGRVRSLGDGWLVADGVQPGDRVVVRGGQQLLAALILPAEPGR
jgi:hypothetical protein